MSYLNMERSKSRSRLPHAFPNTKGNNNSRFSPLREKRRQSDAKWRASVATCYDALKFVVPNMRQLSKRKVSKALILQEAEKHIKDLQAKINDLIEVKAPSKGKAFLWQENRHWRTCTMSQLKTDFARQQHKVFQCATRGRRSYNLLQDIKDEVFGMQAGADRIALINDDQAICSLSNRNLNHPKPVVMCYKIQDYPKQVESAKHRGYMDMPTSSSPTEKYRTDGPLSEGNEAAAAISFNHEPVKVDFNNQEQRNCMLTLSSLEEEREEPFQYTPIRKKNNTQHEDDIPFSSGGFIPTSSATTQNHLSGSAPYDVFRIKEENQFDVENQNFETNNSNDRTPSHFDSSVKEEQTLETPDRSFSTPTVCTASKTKVITGNAKKKLNFTTSFVISPQWKGGLKSPEQHAETSPMISGFTPLKYPKLQLISPENDPPMISPWKTVSSASSVCKINSMDCSEQLLGDNLLSFETFDHGDLGYNIVKESPMSSFKAREDSTVDTGSDFRMKEFYDQNQSKYMVINSCQSHITTKVSNSSEPERTYFNGFPSSSVSYCKIHTSTDKR